MFTCPSCNANLRATAKLCIKCGYRLSEGDINKQVELQNIHTSNDQHLSNNVNPIQDSASPKETNSGPVFDSPIKEIIISNNSFSSQDAQSEIAPKNTKGLNPISLVVGGILALALIMGLVMFISSMRLTKSENTLPQITSKFDVVKEVNKPENQNTIFPSLKKINSNEIVKVNGPILTRDLLHEMLLNFNNIVKVFELKDQIDLTYPKPYKGDVKGARALNDRGLSALTDQNYQDAINSFLKANQLNPSDIEVFNNLGYAYLKAGDLDQAEKILGEVLSIAPSRTSAWANLGEVYANKNKIDSAAASLVLGFKFASNQEKSITYLRNTSENDALGENMKLAAKIALDQISNP